MTTSTTPGPAGAAWTRRAWPWLISGAALDGRKFNDAFARNAEFRASDHMVVHDLYIARVRPAAQLAEPHGWFDIVATVPAEAAFPANTACTMPR